MFMSLITPFLSKFTTYISVLALGAIITKYHKLNSLQTTVVEAEIPMLGRKKISSTLLDSSDLSKD